MRDLAGYSRIMPAIVVEPAASRGGRPSRTARRATRAPPMPPQPLPQGRGMRSAAERGEGGAGWGKAPPLSLAFGLSLSLAGEGKEEAA